MPDLSMKELNQLKEMGGRDHKKERETLFESGALSHLESDADSKVIEKEDNRAKLLDAWHFNTADGIKLEKSKSKKPELIDNTIIELPQPKDITLSGDILFRIKHKTTMSSEMICRFGINMAFIDNNKFTLRFCELDPISIRSNSKFNKRMKIVLHTIPVCLE